jgi:hypothetical protein
MGENLIIRWVKGFFMEIKKVEISMKNPETYQIMRFSSIKEQYFVIFMPR